MIGNWSTIHNVLFQNSGKKTYRIQLILSVDFYNNTNLYIEFESEISTLHFYSYLYF